nr:MAG TPA: hypothetical protein [Caudoviricetes sp.]
MSIFHKHFFVFIYIISILLDIMKLLFSVAFQ